MKSNTVSTHSEASTRRSESIHVGIDAATWSNDRGYGRFTRELVAALARRDAGFRYTLLFDQLPSASLPSGPETLVASTDRSLTESAVGTKSRSLRDMWKMGRMARHARFDVFFFPSVYSYFPILSRVPCVICFHDAIAERFPDLIFPTRLNHRLWRIKTALARFQTSRAMTVSEASARDLETILRIPPQHIDVVTEAADVVFRVIDKRAASTMVRERYGIPVDTTLLVYVGGMNPHKNLIGLLKAMPNVIARRPTVHLAVVGDTSGEGFWDNVEELKSFVLDTPPLSRHVHFTGYVEDGRLVELLGDATALVFPSLWEGFGLPALEAMSCGVPVLASRRGSLPELIGDAGLFFEPEDPSSIEDCLLRFLHDGELRSRLREAALIRAKAFTWDRAAELAENCFRRCYEEAERD